MRTAIIIALGVVALGVAWCAWRWQRRRMDRIREEHELEAARTSEKLARYLDG